MRHNIQKKFSLENKNVILTGASGHLGRNFVNTLSDLKANIVLVDKPSDEFIEFYKYVKQEISSTVVMYECDFESSGSRENLVAQIEREFAEIHVFINNAAFVGTSDLDGWSTRFGNQSLLSWNKALEVNLTAVFDLIQGLLPVFIRSNNVSIVNISSIYGLRAPDWRLYEGTELGNPAAYAASKGGLIQLTRWLASSLPSHVRINAIAPGGILRNQPAEFISRYSKETALGRMATEDDLQGVLGFLATDLSAYITGQVVQVDGGWKL
jgi:NAD(P)-dependent dehydrogenase (short-subunit alcohol dehydrogenase family)